jgi:hypothetical protein
LRHRLAGVAPRIGLLDGSTHFAQCREQPGTQRIGHDVGQHDIGALDDKGRDDRKRRGRRVGWHHDGGAVKFRLPGERDLAAVAAFLLRTDLGAKMLQHQLGMVAAGLLLNDRGHTRRGEPRQQHRGFDLGRGDWRAVEDRHGIARPRKRQRQPAAGFARADDLGAHQFQGIEHPPHRPAAQRGVAVEHGRDRTAGDRPHHQPASGAGIAEIEGVCGLCKPGDADAAHGPGEIPGALHGRAERPHRFAGIEHILAFEQPGNPGFADRKRP